MREGEQDLPPEQNQQWETAKKRVESVIAAQFPDETPEERTRLINITTNTLERFSKLPELKVVVQGQIRTLEYPDGESSGFGIPLTEVNELFEMGFEPHNINKLDPHKHGFFQTISDSIGKRVLGRVIENGVTDKGPFHPAPKIKSFSA